MNLQVLDDAPGIGDAEHPRDDDHTFWWSPEIARLRRERRLAEALAVAWSGMEAVEDVRPLPYGWAWGAAVIARQMHRYDLEVEVIERVLAIAAEGGTPAERWTTRLQVARAFTSRRGRGTARTSTRSGATIVL